MPLAPPGCDPELDLAILHGGDLQWDDGRIVLVIETQAWVIVGEWVHSGLIP